MIRSDNDKSCTSSPLMACHTLREEILDFWGSCSCVSSGGSSRWNWHYSSCYAALAEDLRFVVCYRFVQQNIFCSLPAWKRDLPFQATHVGATVAEKPRHFYWSLFCIPLYSSSFSSLIWSSLRSSGQTRMNMRWNSAWTAKLWIMSLCYIPDWPWY